MFRKSVALIMIVVCTLVCFPVSSFAAESDLQSDFDNGLITLRTGLTYYKPVVGHSGLRYFLVNENHVSSFASYDYTFSKFDNPSLTFGHIFELYYNDGRVLMPEGNQLSFTIHNFYSTIYLGVFDEENFDVSRYYWLNLYKYVHCFMYFYDMHGNSYRVDDSMYDVICGQDDAMITVKMKSDIYDIDVYRIRIFFGFNCGAFSNDLYDLSQEVFTSYSSFHSQFGYEDLFLEIESSDDAVVKGMLSSIIDSIKKLPLLIKSAFSSLFENLTSSVSGFFDSLKNKLTDLFSVFTEEQTTYAPIDEGELPSDYQAAEDEAFDAAGVGDLDSNLDSAFNDANSVFSNNNAYAFISGSMERIVFGNVKISGLVIFSLAMGLCVLVLGRKLNSA